MHGRNLGNCRKRKIRCVADVNDKQGRCTNCMRLKKECSFHPVDQPAPLDGRGKPSARGGSQQHPSASASPATSSGHLSETPSKRPLSRQVLPPGIGAIRGSSQDGDDQASISDSRSSGHRPSKPVANLSAASTGRMAGHSFELSGQPSATWGGPDLETQMHGRAGGLSSPWPSSAAMGEHFPSYDPSQASPGWQPDAQGQQPHESFPWAGMTAPVRSMSYSGEGMPGHQQGHFTTAPPSGLYDRRSSAFPGVYSPAIGGPVPSMEHAVFPSGTAAVGSVSWDETQQQQPAVGAAFQKSDAFDTWGHGPYANGHP